MYVPFITELYRSYAKKLKPGELPSFLLMATQRVQLLPALLPFGALLLMFGRDILVLVLGPAYTHAAEMYARRQRRLERMRLLKMRKQASDASITIGQGSFTEFSATYEQPHSDLRSNRPATNQKARRERKRRI
jgi:hypothetical protein